jgi:hypothetical protein
MTDFNNIEKALTYLGSSLKSLAETAQSNIDLTSIPALLPKRSLSGDHINGGKIVNFSSSGIKDEAKDTQIVITNNNVSIKSLNVGKINENLVVEKSISAENLTVLGTIKANKLEVNEMTSDLRFERSASLEFKTPKGEKLSGKGLLWIGDGYTKQFIYSSSSDFFSSETINLAKDKTFSINNSIVLSTSELGPSVLKSNLRKVGILQGLLVDGDVIIDNYIHYNSTSNRLGIGTETPNAGLSVAEDGIEVVIGTFNQSRGMIGTHASIPFDIITDNKSRISISPSGDVLLGNVNSLPITVKVHGKLGIGVNSIDDRVNFHVAGPIKFNDRIHQYSETVPTSGVYYRGDIVWNSQPDLGKSVGWVCVRDGSPGTWLPFGEIKPVLK